MVLLVKSLSYMQKKKRIWHWKKATINPKNNDSKYSQYSITVTLNHKIIAKYP